ncbi:unnamed protein product, partial [Thlaspi arvense]
MAEFTMDPESIMVGVGDGTDSAVANGGLTMENVAVKGNGHEKQDSAPSETAAGDKVKPKPQKKQVHETSEDDTQSSNSPKADDGKPRKVGALPNYGFSFKCDQRAEKRREIPPTRPKSPKLGRKKTDPEETPTPRIARLSLDERASKDNPAAKGIVPTVELKKQPVRKSLPRLPSQKTVLPDGKLAPAKAATTSAK